MHREPVSGMHGVIGERLASCKVQRDLMEGRKKSCRLILLFTAFGGCVRFRLCQSETSSQHVYVDPVSLVQWICDLPMCKSTLQPMFRLQSFETQLPLDPGQPSRGAGSQVL